MRIVLLFLIGALTIAASPNSDDLDKTLDRLRELSRQAHPPVPHKAPDGLSVEQRSAIGEAVRECWSKDPGSSGDPNMAVTLSVVIDGNGTPRTADIVPEDRQRLADPVYRTFADRAVKAILGANCRSLPSPVGSTAGEPRVLRLRFTPLRRGTPAVPIVPELRLTCNMTVDSKLFDDKIGTQWPLGTANYIYLNVPEQNLIEYSGPVDWDAWLRAIQAKAYRECGGQTGVQLPDVYRVNVVAGAAPIAGGTGEFGLLEAYKIHGERWTVKVNTLPDAYSKWQVQVDLQQAQLRAQQAERQRILDQRQAQAQQKADRRSAFVSSNSVSKFVSQQQLIANPFTVLNQVVAVRTQFRRMLSESDAVFSFNQEELLVTGTPSTQFRGGEDVVLAIKILGTKGVRTAGGEVTLPYGDYVGTYFCISQCRDFYD